MRKTIPALALVAASELVVIGASYYYSSRSPPPPSDHVSKCSDPDSIWSDVYTPYRLDVVKSCITASGVAGNVIEEADGDYHVRLALDSQYSNLTNSANDQY